MTTSARGRYPAPGSPQKSFSMNSIRHFDGPNQQHQHQQQHYIQQNGVPQHYRQGGYPRAPNEGFVPIANTPIPSPPLGHPNGQSHYQQHNGHDSQQRYYHPQSHGTTYQSDSEDELGNYDRKVMSERMSNKEVSDSGNQL